MAISFPNGIVKATGVGVTSVTTGSVTTTTGSTFAIGCSYGASFWGTIDSFSDSKSNTYTSTGSAITDGIKIELAYCENGTGGSGHTATVDGAGSNTDFPVVYFVELAGAATASYDSGAHAKGADTGSPFTITSGTLAQADSAILVLAAAWEGGTINQDITTGYTVTKEDDYANFFGSAMGRKVVSSTSAETATYSPGGTGANTVLGIYAFKAASAAASTINAAAGVATTSTLTGSSTNQAAITAAAGVATTSTMAGSSTDQATISAAAGVATTSAMVGTGITQSTITAAAGQATASTLTGASTAQAAISEAAGLATTSTLAATAIATASFDPAQGVATTSTLFAVGASEFVAAAGQATTSNMAGSSTAQASFVPASGIASTATMVGRDASAPPGTSGSTFRPTYRPRRR